MAQDDSELIGIEEGMTWLPSHVLEEACEANKKCQERQRYTRSQTTYEPLPPQAKHYMHATESHHVRQPKSYYSDYWASGGGRGQGQGQGQGHGHGMQAIFLDSGGRCGGTGVFLPQTVGPNVQSSKKPACAPVLLPPRVVQALNLDVHALGLQISRRRQEIQGKLNNVECMTEEMENKDEKDDLPRRCVSFQNQSASSTSNMFLPKEWTY